MTCADFTAMVTANGFVFDSDPYFDGFVVANASFLIERDKRLRLGDHGLGVEGEIRVDLG